MKFKVFSVFDSKAEAYGTPVFFAATGQAVRAFENQVNKIDENNMVNQYPQDFVLFEIGEYDDSNGMLTPLPSPTSLGTGIEFRRESE